MSKAESNTTRFVRANQERDSLCQFMCWFPVFGQSSAVIGC